MSVSKGKLIQVLSICFSGLLILSGLVWADQPKDSSKKEASVTSVAPKSAKDSTAQIKHKVVAYYFHGNKRCASCKKIEAYTKEAIDSAFTKELKSGQLEWLVINTDSSQNEHFTKDYELYTKSVILSDLHDGKQTRWINLEKVWELLDDQQKFHQYIQDEIKLYLDEKK